MRLWDAPLGGRGGLRFSDASGVHAATVTSARVAGRRRIYLYDARAHVLARTTFSSNTARARATLLTLRHESYRTACNWSRAALSPDGRFGCRGSAGTAPCTCGTRRPAARRAARARARRRARRREPAAIAGVFVVAGH